MRQSILFNNDMNRFYGTGVAMVTPFGSDGQVDYPGLSSLINYLTEGGVEYLVSLGTTGESATLNKDEKKKVFAYTAEVNEGQVFSTIAGIAGNNTAEVVGEYKANFDKNWTAMLFYLASPYYNKRGPEGIFTSIIKR